MTEEQKRADRIRRAVEFNFKEECRQLLPLATDHVAKLLERKDVKPDVLLRTVEILRDSVQGRPAQAITGPDGGPLVGTFTAILARVDGSKVERLAERAAERSLRAPKNGAHEKI